MDQARDASAGRREAVEHGLLPIMRIAGQPLTYDLDDRLAHYDCPGVGIAVMHEGRLDWADGFGRRHADRPDPVGVDTVFMVASCSKPVTAMLALQQVDRGVIDLDTDETVADAFVAADGDGTFDVGGLPAGTYYLVAGSDPDDDGYLGDPGDWYGESDDVFDLRDGERIDDVEVFVAVDGGGFARARSARRAR
jgi:hypothetical protein